LWNFVVGSTPAEFNPMSCLAHVRVRAVEKILQAFFHALEQLERLVKVGLALQQQPDVTQHQERLHSGV
jgi:hypothetical protein